MKLRMDAPSRGTFQRTEGSTTRLGRRDATGRGSLFLKVSAGFVLKQMLWTPAGARLFGDYKMKRNHFWHSLTSAVRTSCSEWLKRAQCVNLVCALRSLAAHDLPQQGNSLNHFAAAKPVIDPIRGENETLKSKLQTWLRSGALIGVRGKDRLRT